MCWGQCTFIPLEPYNQWEVMGCNTRLWPIDTRYWWDMLPAYRTRTRTGEWSGQQGSLMLMSVMARPGSEGV